MTYNATRAASVPDRIQILLAGDTQRPPRPSIITTTYEYILIIPDKDGQMALLRRTLMPNSRSPPQALNGLSQRCGGGIVDRSRWIFQKPSHEGKDWSQKSYGQGPGQ